MASGDTKTESYLRAAAEGTRADLPSDTCCNTKTQNLILGVANRIMDVEDEVEELKNNPDVVDIVDTYADLQAYDTQHLTDNDIIRVLSDETHNNNSTYYRYTKSTDTWTFIGEISGGGSSVTVVQSTGGSQTNVMSQNATTKMIYDDAATTRKICIGNSNTHVGTNSIGIGAANYTTGTQNIAIGNASQAGAGSNHQYNVAIGNVAKAVGTSYAISIGYTSNATGNSSIAIGGGGSGAAKASGIGSVALGVGSQATRTGEINVGTTDVVYGFNSTGYRLISGVHDGQDVHDVATVAQGNTLATSAPTTSTAGVLGQLYTDTTNMHTYQLGSVDTTDPSNPVYNWVQRW